MFWQSSSSVNFGSGFGMGRSCILVSLFQLGLNEKLGSGVNISTVVTERRKWI